MTDHYAVVLSDLEAQRERIDVAIAAIKALRPATAMSGHSLHVSAIEEVSAPPAPPLRPKRVIPTDPEELRAEAQHLMNAGFGMNEVKEELQLTESQAQAFFFGT